MAHHRFPTVSNLGASAFAVNPVSFAVAHLPRPAYLRAYGVAASQCATIDAQIAALEANKIGWGRKGHKEWKQSISTLKDARKSCASPTVDATLPSGLPAPDLSTTSSALPVIGVSTIIALAAIGGLAYWKRRSAAKTNPRKRKNRRR